MLAFWMLDGGVWMVESGWWGLDGVAWMVGPGESDSLEEETGRDWRLRSEPRAQGTGHRPGGK